MANKTKEKFALIGHPPDLELFRAYIRHLKPDRTYRDELIIKLFEWTPSYKVKEWRNYTYDGQNYADGLLIMVPFLPEMREIKLADIMKKIEQAFTIAKDNGCTIASLGAFTSILLQAQERSFSQRFGLKITSGNGFTTALIVRSIEELAQRFGLDLAKAQLAIIGASGDIGSGCLTYFGSKVKKLNLSARGLPRLKEIVTHRRDYIDCDVEFFNDNQLAASGADIVIFATSSYNRLFGLKDFAPGTIVCDASAPLNVNFEAELREDVFLYHGGIVGFPYPLDVGFDIGVPRPYATYGCMFEGVLHTLDDDLPYCWGQGNISPQALNKFLSYLDGSFLRVVYSCGNHIYSPEELTQYSQRIRTQAFVQGRPNG